MEIIFKKHQKQGTKLVKYINMYANKSRFERPYKRKFWNLAKLLGEYEKKRDITLMTDSIDVSTFEDFLFFLKETRPYRNSTIARFQSLLCRIMKEAEKCGYKVNFGFLEMKLREEEAVSVYLTNDEIERIFNLKVSEGNICKRDRFIIGCCTGLRYSDYSRVAIDNFIGNTIQIKTQKTGAKVVLPVHWMIKDIIARNNGDLPKLKTSQQEFNKAIKRICKKAGINTPVLIERTEGNKIVKRVVKKYELISSHTARRSFATNLYLNGVSVARIMLLTGHKTESSFFKYIRIDKTENARILSENDFFNKQILTEKQ